MTAAPPFQRTVCACPAEVAYCKTRPAGLVPGDVERIAAFLKLPVDECLQLYFSASDRTTVLAGGQARTVWQLVPITQAHGCVFLGADDRCKIHAVSPFGCAYFDSHMNAREGDRRSRWMIYQLSDPAYVRQIEAVKHLPVLVHACKIDAVAP